MSRYRLFVHRVLIHLLGLAGLLGCGLSLIALGLLLYIRINILQQQGPAAGGATLDSTQGILFLLDAFREPGTTFLLSALVFVLCEMALGSTHRPQPREPDPQP
jgi:hypothetical protein